MKTQLVRFNSTDGLGLAGLLFTPKEKTDKIIINVHGSGGSFYGVLTDSLAPTFASNNIAYLAFNNRGAETVKKFYKGQDQVVIGNEHEVFNECIFDIESAINFAKGLGYKDITLQGHSLGCNKVVYYAIQKKFGGGLILLAPVDIARDKPNLSRTKPWEKDSEIDMFRYRDGKMVSELGALQNKILVQTGSVDPHIDQPNKQDTLDYLKKAFAKSDVQTILIGNADHSYRGFETVVAKNTVKWLGGK